VNPEDPSLQGRILFTVLYELPDTSITPSQEEQDALDDALLEFYTKAVSDGLGSSYTLLDSRLVSSQQGYTSGGWEQQATIQYSFDSLPPLDTLLSTLTGNGLTNDYFQNGARRAGPTFATATGIQFEFDVPSYGRRLLVEAEEQHEQRMLRGYQS